MFKLNRNYILGLKRFLFSINALIYRELKTKISSATLGLLGVFAEPLLGLIVFLAIFSLGKAVSVAGLNTVIFLSTGIIIFNIFSGIAYRSLNAIQANQNLIKSYRFVRIIDTVIARSIIEIYLNIILFLLILVFFYLGNSQIILSNINLSILILFLSATFSFGVGLIILVVSTLFPVTQNLLPVVTRPLFIISGVFFSLSTLPESLKKYVSWNPILHYIELLRLSFTNSYSLDVRITLPYALFSSLTTLLIGLFLYFSLEKELLKK